MSKRGSKRREGILHTVPILLQPFLDLLPDYRDPKGIKQLPITCKRNVWGFSSEALEEKLSVFVVIIKFGFWFFLLNLVKGED